MSADLSARLDLRRRARRRTRLRRILLGTLGAAVSCVLVWLVLFSSVLETRQVSVEGTGILTAEQVTQTAQVPIGTRWPGYRAARSGSGCWPCRRSPRSGCTGSGRTSW